MIATSGKALNHHSEKFKHFTESKIFLFPRHKFYFSMRPKENHQQLTAKI